MLSFGVLGGGVCGYDDVWLLRLQLLLLSLLLLRRCTTFHIYLVYIFTSIVICSFVRGSHFHLLSANCVIALNSRNPFPVHSP